MAKLASGFSFSSSFVYFQQTQQTNKKFHTYKQKLKALRI